MKLRYGTYTHAAGEVSVSINKTVRETDAGVPYETEHTWVINGTAFGNTTAEVVASLGSLERAYGTWFRDAALFDETTGVVCHALPNAGSTSGVRVLQPPSYPRGDGAELSTFRNYTITLSAIYPAVGQAALIKQWTETLTFSGGIPDRRMVTTVNSLPVPYITARFTPYRATQVGSAVGAYSYPPVPPPLWPNSLDGPDHPVSYASPTTQKGRLIDWPISWNYRFVASAPLVGRPNVLPTG